LLAAVSRTSAVESITTPPVPWIRPETVSAALSASKRTKPPLTVTGSPKSADDGPLWKKPGGLPAAFPFTVTPARVPKLNMFTNSTVPSLIVSPAGPVIVLLGLARRNTPGPDLVRPFVPLKMPTMLSVAVVPATMK
jgi:hypothetical protein